MCGPVADAESMATINDHSPLGELRGGVGCGAGRGGVRGFFTGRPRHSACMLLAGDSAAHGESLNAFVESKPGVNWSSIVPRL